MPDAGEEVLAFPDTQARRLAGVSMRRLRYWEQVGLIVPSIKRRLSDRNTVRLYSYQDLLALSSRPEPVTCAAVLRRECGQRPADHRGVGDWCGGGQCEGMPGAGDHDYFQVSPGQVVL